MAQLGPTPQSETLADFERLTALFRELFRELGEPLGLGERAVEALDMLLAGADGDAAGVGLLKGMLVVVAGILADRPAVFPRELAEAWMAEPSLKVLVDCPRCRYPIPGLPRRYDPASHGYLPARLAFDVCPGCGGSVKAR